VLRHGEQRANIFGIKRRVELMAAGLPQLAAQPPAQQVQPPMQRPDHSVGVVLVSEPPKAVPAESGNALCGS
jgi:hypothetical protein